MPGLSSRAQKRGFERKVQRTDGLGVRVGGEGVKYNRPQSDTAIGVLTQDSQF